MTFLIHTAIQIYSFGKIKRCDCAEIHLEQHRKIYYTERIIEMKYGHIDAFSRCWLQDQVPASTPSANPVPIRRTTGRSLVTAWPLVCRWVRCRGTGASTWLSGSTRFFVRPRRAWNRCSMARNDNGGQSLPRLAALLAHITRLSVCGRARVCVCLMYIELT